MVIVSSLLFSKGVFAMVITHTRIADLNIEFKTTYYNVNAMCRPYPAEFETPDVSVTVYEDEAMRDYEIGVSEGCSLGPGYYEGIIGFRKLSAELHKFDAFVLHGATFAVDDTGVIFCALSGTGKTTHMLLWQKLLGERFKIINGDKPIIRFIDGVPYIYGNPWMGKEHFGTNTKAELKKICFIERGVTNEVVDLEAQDFEKRISSQMVQPETSAGILKNMEFMQKLLDTCDTYVIKCNMEDEAAKVAYDYIFNK